MKKQRGFLILAFIMVLGITGCGTAQSGSSDDGSVTLEIFNIKTETAEQMDALVEDFEKDHPQIKINLTTVGGGTDATAALQSKFSSGDEPDIFMLGGLADTQIWQHKLYDLGETTLAKQAIEGTLEGATLDETVYGLPMNIEGYGWLINQDIFKQAGIDSGSINSFEAFEEAVQLLDSKKDELGLQGVFGFSGAETWVSSQYSSNFLAPEF
ncbi:ABC transporter substrate-binding protein [Enterococcus spodopteracolus]|uniref:ABC transporter substrate-binding protein n=1 Tax=Enterococcus spodopteracolus TaxID=3034501 RepID=UPI00384DE1CE